MAEPLAKPRQGYMWSQHLDEPGRIRLCEVPIPDVGDGDILVGIRTALTCGTDLKTYRRGHPLIPTPCAFGHEFSGDVVCVGANVTRFKVGDRLASVHTAPCGSCSNCARGYENLCKTLVQSMVLGAYAQFIKLPPAIHEINSFVMPPQMTYDEAALLEPLACVVHGMSKLNISAGSKAVVIGAGPIGLLFVQTLMAAGVEVLVLARRAMRLAAARDLGAAVVVDVEINDARAAVLDWTDQDGADIIVECTGRPEVWSRTTEIVCSGGEIMLFGGCPKDTRVPFDAYKIHYGEVTLHGAFHFRPADVRVAFELIESGAISSHTLITRTIHLQDLQEGIDSLIAGEAIKLAVKPPVATSDQLV